MSTNQEIARKKIIKKILNDEIEDKKELERVKRKISKKLNLSGVPANSEILSIASEENKEKLVPLLRKKPVRSISGVTVITVMPEPEGCPKDEPCIYCPGGPNEDTPQSYTGKEPASARAKHASYDPEVQVSRRIKQLEAIGHKVDKIELIIFGGTFLSRSVDYQKKFIRKCLDTISDSNSENLQEAKEKAENSDKRVIGITFETRPDYCRKEHINNILNFGGTRVELGVQTLENEIYEKVKREHRVEDVVKSTREAKDSGLAIVYHMMPGLPGSNPKKDLEHFKELFENPNFRPDMLKIYPCLVTKNTKLYEMWKNDEFQPLEEQKAIDLISKMKEKVPEYVRIQRIQRDIPSDQIEEGIQKGNLRDIIKEKMEREGKKCKCIRCREVGHRIRKENLDLDIKNAEILRKEYQASEGKEIFLSFENKKKNVIFGHIRCRIPSEKSFRKEINEKTSLIRSLHVFGNLVSVGKNKEKDSWQHKGIGEKLLKRSEKIVKEEYDKSKMSILSGIGSRPYYRQFNYSLEGTYMTKKI